jgi:hypothetical protein
MGQVNKNKAGWTFTDKLTGEILGRRVATFAVKRGR